MSRLISTTSSPPRARPAIPGVSVGLALLALSLATSRAAAQTDYYNTDAGRPITVEDASSIELRAVELQVAPLRLERAPGGVYSWGVEPALAVGLLPRTQVELGFPLVYNDLGAGRRSTGLAGLELSALHSLNVETSIPALAVAGDVLLPVGALGPDRAYASVKGIATKTFPWARFHLNGQYTIGDRLGVGEPDEAAHGVAELSRWMGGVAVDRTLPLQSMLLTAELVARQPLLEEADVTWDTAAGARFQLSPRVAVDGGAGYRLTGRHGWFATFGAAVSLGLPWSPR
ncbi:MAG TPA: hypothetical protein VF048_03030 [Gemmatimonadaceae bacterium]|jgi:hypothetical protein